MASISVSFFFNGADCMIVLNERTFVDTAFAMLILVDARATPTRPPLTIRKQNFQRKEKKKKKKFF
jgi:hypothetical protein